METAASIVGLLAVGVKIGLALDQFVSSCVDAPVIARTVCDEVRDFRFALSKLQPYVDGTVAINLLGASATDVDHLSLTLASCLATFSRLEKIVDRLKLRERMDAVDRLRWIWSEAAIAQLVQRLQHHKSTLTLLLTIWISESCTEVEECTDRLNGELAETLYAQSTLVNEMLDLPPKLESSSSSILTVNNQSLRSFRRAFESSLYSSRPYRNMTNCSTISLTSSQHRGTRWSLFTGDSNQSVFSLPITTLTLSGNNIRETTSISSIPLPIHPDTLYNPWWYSTTITPSKLRSPTSQSSTQRDLNRMLLIAGHSSDWGTVIRALALGALVDTSMVGYTGTVLHCAVHQKVEEIVRVLLDRGANPNIVDFKGYTPMHYACRTAHMPTFRLLLDRGANIESMSLESGQTPLHFAADAGCTAIVLHLLDQGAKIEARDDNNSTPLHLAAMNDPPSTETVRLLLDRGANPHASDRSRRTPLHIAAYHDSAEIAQLLLDHGADALRLDDQEMTPLQLAMNNRCYLTASCLLNLQALTARYDATDYTPFFVAALRNIGNSAMSWHSLRGHVISNARDRNGQSMLHLAARNGYVDFAQHLLDHGSGVNMEDTQRWTPLHWAAFFGHLEIVSLLVDHGATVDIATNDFWTPLALAVSNGPSHDETVSLLLERGANPNVPNILKSAPLHNAARDGHQEIVRLLLAHGADVQAKDLAGCAPLHLACSSGHQQVVRLLLAGGADINARTPEGQTPLHLAAGYDGGQDGESSGMVGMLLEAGASVQERDEAGSTPLHLATHPDCIATIRLLLDAGADIKTQDGSGVTPLGRAESSGCGQEILELLGKPKPEAIKADIRM